MPETRARDLASSLGQAVSKNNITLSGGLSVSGLTTYTNKASLPGSYDSDNAGSLAFTTDSDRLYIHTGTGWHNVAIINTTPVWVTQPSGSYELASDATAYKNGTQTDIILRARDSEGMAITWSATPDSAFNNMAYIAQDSTGTNVNKFIIEPKSRDSAGSNVMPQGSVTFKASDGVNIATATSTFTLTFDATVTNSQFTTHLLKASGNNLTNTSFTDGSSNNVTVTTNGDVRTSSFTPHHPGGYSTYFDGLDDYLQITNGSSQFVIGTGAFTLECWVICEEKSTEGGAYRRIFMIDDVGNQDGNFQLLVHPTSGSTTMWTNSSDLEVNGTKVIDDGEWHHIACVRSGTTVTCYIDGKADSSATYNGAIGTNQNGGSPMPRIGEGNGSGSFKGYIYELRLVVGTAIYTADFVPPTAKLTAVTNTKLLTQNVPYIKDNSSAGHAITQSGQLVHRRKSPHKHDAYNSAIASHGFSMYSDGTGDYLSHNDIGTDGLNDFTIEAWVYPETAYNPWANALYSAGAHNDNTSSNFVYIGWGANGEPVVFQPGSILSGTNGDIKLNQWQHVAFVRASNQISVYINGVKKAGPSSMSGALPAAPTGRAFINTQAYDAGHVNRTIKGYISDFRLHNTAVYTSNFTPATQPLTATSGTQYLMTSASPGVYDASGGDIKLVGNTKSSTGLTKYASSSMLFDGTGDVIQIEDSTDIDFADEDFTMEGWYNADATNGDHYIISSDGGAGNQSHWGINIYQGNWRVGAFNDKLIGGVGSGVNAGMSTSTWHHFAFIQTNKIIKFFINGTQAGSDVNVSSTTTTFNSNGAFKIGGFHSNNGNNWDGYLEDIRITKGLCRYPFVPLKETFTTSTSAQNGITCTASNVKLLALTTATVTQDISSSSHTITNVNSVTTSNLGPGGDMKSALFDASDNEKLTIPDGTWKTWGSTFTIECWINGNSFPHSTQNYIFGDYDSGGASASTSVNLISNNSGVLYVAANIGGSLSTILTSTVAISLHKWYHVALVRSSNNWYLFLNGTLVHENTSATGTVNDSSQVFAIGGTGAYTGRGWDGYISNFRVNNAQALYTKTFTPVASELTA